MGEKRERTEREQRENRERTEREKREKRERKEREQRENRERKEREQREKRERTEREKKEKRESGFNDPPSPPPHPSFPSGGAHQPLGSTCGSGHEIIRKGGPRGTTL